MTEEEKQKKLSVLNFDTFRQLAKDPELSKYERIGFYNSHREGREQAIFDDILAKVNNIHKKDQKVLDIGPGCSDLPHLIIEHCNQHNQELWLVDSDSMLAQLPDDKDLHKHEGAFPKDVPQLCQDMQGQFDVIITYSVYQYVVEFDNPLEFLDTALSLLAPGGQLFIGDMPNASKRNRFFSTDAGVAFHQKNNNTTDKPSVDHLGLQHGKMDDSTVFMMMQRARAAGFESYLLPQPAHLPMANRREDLLIVKY